MGTALSQLNQTIPYNFQIIRGVPSMGAIELIAAPEIDPADPTKTPVVGDVVSLNAKGNFERSNAKTDKNSAQYFVYDIDHLTGNLLGIKHSFVVLTSNVDSANFPAVNDLVTAEKGIFTKAAAGEKAVAKVIDVDLTSQTITATWVCLD